MSVREGPKVSRAGAATFDEMIELVELQAFELSGRADAKKVDLMVRTFEPVEQVFARIEVTGPRRGISRPRAGIDVRGDGSLEAYTGRLRREVVEQAPGESVMSAFRRTVAAA